MKIYIYFGWILFSSLAFVSAKEKWKDKNYVPTEEEMKLGWQGLAEKWIAEEQAAQLPPKRLKTLRDDEIITLEEGITAAEKDKAVAAAQAENNKFVSKIPVTPDPVGKEDPFATPAASEETVLTPEEQLKQELIAKRKREINAEAWKLVKKEFPHLFADNGRPSAETVNWMREWDEYYKVHDPELAKHPGRPIYYARRNDRQLREANAAARQAAAELYESSGQKAMDELKADLAQQAKNNAAETRAAIQAAQESNRRQQAELAAQAAEFQRQQQLNMQQQEDEMRRKMEDLERAANPNRYKGYTTW